jgi:transposase
MTQDTPSSVTLLNPGAVPIALCLARVAGIRQLVEEFTAWDPEDDSISPGILLETLIAALLCGYRPLYKVEIFWQENRVVEIFYKNDGITSEQLNDDAYGRLLDRLSRIDMKSLFEIICIRMLQYHGLEIVLTHSDTTSISVEGAYLTNTAEISSQSSPVDEQSPPDENSPIEESFEINFGHSKDHRPNQKQFKIGLSVQENGLPVSGEILSGNESDHIWNPHAVEELSAMLSAKGYDNVVHLADSALVSTKTLTLFVERCIQFISRFPETFNITGEMKIEAWKADDWEDIGFLAQDEKDAAYYRTWETEREIEGHIFKFIVVHSSKLEKRKEKKLKEKVEGEKKGLERQSKKLRTKRFACEPDARQEGQLLQATAEKQGFSTELEVTVVEKLKYSRKGRPKKGDVPTKEISWHVEVKIGSMKPEVYEQMKKLASTFVLIHRLKEKMTSEEILRSYKNQDKVEQGFKFLKQPLYLGPVYTKIKSRVKSLGYVFLFVLLLAKYLEYRVRIGMQQSGGAIIIGGQKVKNPSTKTILEILNKMLIYAMNGEMKLPDSINKTVLNVIHWAGFNEDVYIRGFTGDHFLDGKDGTSKREVAV